MSLFVLCFVLCGCCGLISNFIRGWKWSREGDYIEKNDTRFSTEELIGNIMGKKYYGQKTNRKQKK